MAVARSPESAGDCLVTREDHPMKLRVLSLRWPALVVAAVVAVLLTPASAGAKKPPHGGGGGFSATSRYVKNYANVLNGVQYSL